MKGDISSRIERVFSSNGLGRIFPRYEERPEQKQLAKLVLEAFQRDGIALVEAGTGTGKSLSYLIPALLWSLEKGERVVISTNTIPLQEQLLQREIPLACRAIGKEVPSGIAKGISNYVCELKLLQKTQEISFLAQHHELLFQKIRNVRSDLDSPMTRSSLPFHIPHDAWKEIQADGEDCLGATCPLFSSCHFFQARKALQEMKLIVVNHHLLLHDLLQRKEADRWDGTFILPPYSRVLIDEAHHLEEVALELFQTKVERFRHLSYIRKFSHQVPQLETASEKNLLFRLLLFLRDDKKCFEPSLRLDLSQYIEQEIVPHVTAMEKSSENFFEALLELASSQPLKSDRGGHCRITPELQKSDGFEKSARLFQEHDDFYKTLEASLEAFFNRLHHEGIKPLEREVNGSEKSPLSAPLHLLKSLFQVMQSYREKITTHILGLRSFFSSIEDPEKVVWVEWTQKSFGGIEIAALISSFDVSQQLADTLFSPLATTVLLSATLTAKKSFSFMKDRLGILPLEEQQAVPLLEAIYPSPFPYKQTTVLAIADDLMPSESEEYYDKLETAIFTASKAADGGTLVLFTSYSTLERLYGRLNQKLASSGLSPMKQGELPRTPLLEKFRKDPKAVLCATDSFWEGVDIPGQALRCVIITKLPFDVPSDPIYAARHEALKKKGIDSFSSYALPKACVKFQQAFGRLIRSSSDYGAVVCLDARLKKRGYGVFFLQSLPECRTWSGSYRDVDTAVLEALKR